jgi:hypothetical protein
MSRKIPENPPKQVSMADRKAKRLAEALRANLRRRKAGGRPEEADSPGKPQTNHEAGEE